MGGIWQSLKRKISRRHPGREPTSVDSKPEPARAAQQTDEPTNDTSEIETESNHVSTPNGLIENPADHGAEVQQANELGGPHPEIPLNPEQKALIDSLRVEYEDVEDDPSQYEEAVVVEYVDHETQIEAEPKIHLESPQNRLHIPTSGLISGHKVEAVPYSIQFPIPATISAPPDLNTVGVSNLEAGSDSAKRSYLSIIPTTIQAVTENTTLFVWHANFHPAIGRRFSSVRVACKFASAPGTPRVTPASLLAGVEVRAFAPHKSYGASSREQRKITWGLELPLTVPAGPVQVGVTPSGSRETSKEVEHAFTIEGSARGTPLRNSCVWTVQENASTERGIPSELQLAALVKHSGLVQFDVDIEGYTAGGYLPSHHLRPKTDAMGRRKIIDPAKYAGLLHEFDFGGKGQAGCAKLLEQWTGQVQGAILEFDQPVIMA